MLARLSPLVFHAILDYNIMSSWHYVARAISPFSNGHWMQKAYCHLVLFLHNAHVGLHGQFQASSLSVPMVCLVQLWALKKLLWVMCCEQTINCLVKTTIKRTISLSLWNIYKMSLYFLRFGKAESWKRKASFKVLHCTTWKHLFLEKVASDFTRLVGFRLSCSRSTLQKLNQT